ncbi:hypothetical protein [Polyangium mundeleinium]|uniref:WD40 repeat domain-containing protein n=1 Tax=Polyangium mundeleinium TaxID=2995306 RepID=A0ABT5F9W8_9BACT|nr:hypothetical protein [Polyangium mundeleinium]MDC0749967.1 hypothetical protein [Polyangium mundeleinium]
MQTVTIAPEAPQPIENPSLTLSIEGAKITSLVATGRNDILIGGYFFRKARIGNHTVIADPTEDPPQVHVFLARAVEGQVQWAREFPAMDVALARSSDGIPWAVLTYERPVALGSKQYVPQGKATEDYDWKGPQDLLLWRVNPTGDPVTAVALASQTILRNPLAGLAVASDGSPIVLASFKVPVPPIRTGKHPVVIASFDKDSARHLVSMEIPEVADPKKLVLGGSGHLLIAGDDDEVFGGETVLLRISTDGKRIARTALGENAVLALACRPNGNAVAVVGPSRHLTNHQPLKIGETRLLEVGGDGQIAASHPLDSAFDIIDLAILPSGDVVLFGTKLENERNWRAWVEVRGANGESRQSRSIRSGWSEAYALATESGGAIWVAAREDPQGAQTPLALAKVTVRRLAAE